MTNIAEALRLDPTIIDNISVLQVMGGAVFVPGNLPVLPDPPFSTNTVAEFNCSRAFGLCADGHSEQQ